MRPQDGSVAAFRALCRIHNPAQQIVVLAGAYDVRTVDAMKALQLACVSLVMLRAVLRMRVFTVRL